MAAIERGMGADEAVVRGWLTRALTAPRGPQWVCDNCQHIHANWMPVCTNCHGFDTLSWRRPPHAEVAMPGSTEMLPLVVGRGRDSGDRGDDRGAWRPTGAARRRRRAAQRDADADGRRDPRSRRRRRWNRPAN